MQQRRFLRFPTAMVEGKRKGAAKNKSDTRYGAIVLLEFVYLNYFYLLPPEQHELQVFFAAACSFPFALLSFLSCRLGLRSMDAGEFSERELQGKYTFGSSGVRPARVNRPTDMEPRKSRLRRHKSKRVHLRGEKRSATTTTKKRRTFLRPFGLAASLFAGSGSINKSSSIDDRWR